MKNMKKYKNTIQKGSVRYIVFKEDSVWYAAGLEFNIVESGSTPEEALLLLWEALTGYLESAKKVRARPNILNQKPDPEYEEMWGGRGAAKPTGANKNIFSFGEWNIRGAANRSLAPA